ncbi:MAG: hypothetical protein IPG02_15550 [Ignavibacteria bacterium]|nr:hypothetical protein [Ignavibacteria bacterium]
MAQTFLKRGQEYSIFLIKRHALNHSFSLKKRCWSGEYRRRSAVIGDAEAVSMKLEVSGSRSKYAIY